MEKILEIFLLAIKQGPFWKTVTLIVVTVKIFFDSDRSKTRAGCHWVVVIAWAQKEKSEDNVILIEELP